jgi:hypothetical protein
MKTKWADRMSDPEYVKALAKAEVDVMREDLAELRATVETLTAALEDAAGLLRKPKNPHTRAENALAVIDAALSATKSGETAPCSGCGEHAPHCHCPAARPTTPAREAPTARQGNRPGWSPAAEPVEREGCEACGGFGWQRAPDGGFTDQRCYECDGARPSPKDGR